MFVSGWCLFACSLATGAVRVGLTASSLLPAPLTHMYDGYNGDPTCMTVLSRMYDNMYDNLGMQPN